MVHIQVMNPQQVQVIIGDFPVHGFKYRFEKVISMDVKCLVYFFLHIGWHGAVIDDMTGFDPVSFLEIPEQVGEDRDLFHMKLSGDIPDRHAAMVEPAYLDMAFFL